MKLADVEHQNETDKYAASWTGKLESSLSLHHVRLILHSRKLCLLQIVVPGVGIEKQNCKDEFPLMDLVVSRVICSLTTPRFAKGIPERIESSNDSWVNSLKNHSGLMDLILKITLCEVQGIQGYI